MCAMMVVVHDARGKRELQRRERVTEENGMVTGQESRTRTEGQAYLYTGVAGYDNRSSVDVNARE